MTNQPTPQQLLEIARVVEPEKVWRIESYGVVGVSDKSPAVLYQPFEEIDRGQAQLMKVVFAAAKKTEGVQDYKLLFALSHDDIEGLLNLAHEVLCNAD